MAIAAMDFDLDALRITLDAERFARGSTWTILGLRSLQQFH